jgi:hypothetical protein
MHAAVTSPGSPRSPRRFVFSLLLAWSCAVRIGPALAAEVDFARDVRPLLNQHCTPCHGGVKKAGGVTAQINDSPLIYGTAAVAVVTAVLVYLGLTI